MGSGASDILKTNKTKHLGPSEGNDTVEVHESEKNADWKVR